MDNFDQKLLAWSDDVVKYCHSIATNPQYDMDLAFFAFQSAPKEKPDLLILGINPGGKDGVSNYEGQYSNSIWGLTDKNEMTPEVFAKGNPCFHTLEKWPIWQNLIKSFSDLQMNNLLSNSMYMNMVYFNSKTIRDLIDRNHGMKAFNKCRDFSVDLITKVIKPKQILCLGTAGCFGKLPYTDYKCLLKNEKIRLVIKGKLSNIPVYGIPHPTGNRVNSKLSPEDRIEIGEVLKNEFLFL
jgi:hypothetical protein